MIHDYIDLALSIGPVALWALAWAIMATTFAIARLR